MATINIWHNISTDRDGRSAGMAAGYREGHALVPVASYRLAGNTPALGLELGLAQEAFDTFNVGDDPDFNGSMEPYRRELATSYRQRKNRSLSVGDVVQVDETWLACASAGWARIEEPQFFTVDARRHGTTPLDRI